MQSMAFVVGRHEWKPVCRLESELLEDLRGVHSGASVRRVANSVGARVEHPNVGHTPLASFHAIT